MTVTGHKFGGPYGTGALLLKRGVACTPLTHGGGQEREVRSGTLDVPGVAGFAAACRIAVAGAAGPGRPGRRRCATNCWPASASGCRMWCSTAPDRRLDGATGGRRGDGCRATRTCPSPAARAIRC